MVCKHQLKFSISGSSLHEELAPFEAKRALVVCFFGRGDYGDIDSRSNVLDLVLDKKVFTTSIDENLTKSNSVPEIEGYYDTGMNTLFLSIRGTVDPCSLVPYMEEFEKDVQTKGFLMVWSELKEAYARNVLFACLVSHLLVIVEPTANFDVGTITFLKTLENVRQKAKEHISEAVRTVSGVPKAWALQGRPCSPRLLFLFLKLPTAISQLKESSTSKFETSVRKLESSLEDKIYRLFRKLRLITNTSANSLLALPSTQPFVHIFRGKMELKNRTEFMLDLLSQHCGDKTPEPPSVGPSGESLLRSFLEEHIEKGLTDGFDDNVSRHGAYNTFEITSSQIWWKVASRIYKFMVVPDTLEGKESSAAAKLSQSLQNLKNLTGTDVKFSEIKCSKVLPMAVGAYQENLPNHYTREHHEAKLAHAVALFSMHARGPLVEKFLAKLEEDCVKIWQNGRQMCEVRSLTGNPCVNPVHRLPQEDKDEVEKSLPAMDHSNGVRMVAACNCGRVEGPREDPFDLKTANFSFYDLMEIDCCSGLEGYDFRKEVDDTSGDIKEEASFMPYLTAPDNIVPAFPSWSLKCIGQSSFYSHSLGIGDLMTGFLTNSAFLLPWDVAVRIEHGEKWPTILESSRRHRPGRNDKQTKSPRSETEFSVKIFIGEEYECPRGHRFMSSGPEKVLRATSTGVKETASRIVGSDMPIYMACPCRTNKPLIAQLMRIHIVTPKAPVAVTLDPHIKFGTEPAITFTTGLAEKAKLSQSSYWVLRLPYIYQGLDGPIQPPKDPATAASQAVLLKGAFGVIETPVK